MNNIERTQQVLTAMNKTATEGIWEGRLTELVASLGHTSYYGRIVALLKESGAAEQLQRGAMGVPSRWRVINATPELETGPRTGAVRKRDRLEARIEALESRLQGLDIPLAIGTMIQRMDILERLVLGENSEGTNGNRQTPDSTATQ